mgnify:CR=1 FL=1
MKKRLQWYNDSTLEAFYESVSNFRARIKLPHHDVVYVRAALRERTGKGRSNFYRQEERRRRYSRTMSYM